MMYSIVYTMPWHTTAYQSTAYYDMTTGSFSKFMLHIFFQTLGIGVLKGVPFAIDNDAGMTIVYYPIPYF